MDHLTLLAYAEDELNRVIAGLDESEMDAATNCPPWTVRHLASHVLKNQLFWAGSVTGQQLMALDESMAAVPYEGDLAPIADEVTAQALQLWRSDGVMEAHARDALRRTARMPSSWTSRSSMLPRMPGTCRRAWGARSSSLRTRSPR